LYTGNINIDAKNAGKRVKNHMGVAIGEYRVDQSRKSVEGYLHNLTKRRILFEWHKRASEVRNNVTSEEELFQKFLEIFEDLKPMILSAYKYDFKKSPSLPTLIIWLIDNGFISGYHNKEYEKDLWFDMSDDIKTLKDMGFIQTDEYGYII
jgi:hypothetical protein